MKKTLFIIAALFAFSFVSMANNEIVVDDVTIPQGGTGIISVALDNDKAYTGFEMAVTLPEGLSINGVEKSERLAESHTLTVNSSTGKIGCLSGANESITGTSRTLFTIIVTASPDLAIGTNLVGTLTGIEFATTIAPDNLSDVTFNIIIGENRILLDENSPSAPENATGVNVRVKRTINAGEWSTLVLPFDMSEQQVKEAFGNGVQLASLNGWETTEYDDDDNATAISVSFADETAITANIPYIIKVVEPVTQFELDGIDITVDEEPATTVGKKSKGTFGSFTGTYIPITIDEECLFLNGNNFWYSTGKSKLKGYRAYFYFQDVLDSYSNGSNARVAMTFQSGTEGIDEKVKWDNSNGNLYDIQGHIITERQNKTSAHPEIYIRNGKKVIIK